MNRRADYKKQRDDVRVDAGISVNSWGVGGQPGRLRLISLYGIRYTTIVRPLSTVFTRRQDECGN
jgi:hypothetical protein